MDDMILANFLDDKARMTIRMEIVLCGLPLTWRGLGVAPWGANQGTLSG
jgi:hypothetical protein